MKFIIDTDVGIDDAVALLMVLAHPEAKIKAISSVMGNVSLTQATHNAGVVLDVAHAPAIPLYKGCTKPLMQNEPLNAIEVHAADGLGGLGKGRTSRVPEAGHASLALIRLAREQPGELTLLTLGPLTNVALAVRLDPDFLGNFKRIVIMAGAVAGRGNTSPAAEFNVAVDPEAAKIVFKASQDIAERVWLVSWEASLTHATRFDVWRNIIEGDSATAQFVQAMTGHIEKVMASYNAAAVPWADPLAAAIALEPDIVLSHEARFVDVEVGHNLARGQTIVDYLPRSNRPASMNIVREVDRQRFEALLQLVVK